MTAAYILIILQIGYFLVYIFLIKSICLTIRSDRSKKTAVRQKHRFEIIMFNLWHSTGHVQCLCFGYFLSNWIDHVWYLALVGHILRLALNNCHCLFDFEQAIFDIRLQKAMLSVWIWTGQISMFVSTDIPCLAVKQPYFMFGPEQVILNKLCCMYYCKR